MLSTPLPNYPWEQVAAELFELKNSSYLLVTDYYIHYLLKHHRMLKSRLRIPAVLVTDNGPEFDLLEIKQFSQPMD